jgi:type II secretory pathway component PulM
VPGAVGDVDAAIERVLHAHAIVYRRLANEAQGDDASGVVIDAVPFDALVDALDTLAHDADVRPIEANITARVEPGVVRAELRLTH